MDTETIKDVERNIDDAFSTNRLKEIGYSQAVWTLLSVVEDRHLNITQINPLTDEQLTVYIDRLLNALTYPLRVCYSHSDRTIHRMDKRLNNEHYQLADDWLNAAYDYCDFCALFSLWHKDKAGIQIKENKLIASYDWSLKPEYEAYNRLLKNEGKEKSQMPDPMEVISLVKPYIYTKHDQFKVNFNPKLVSNLLNLYKPYLKDRYFLPGDWQFSNFTFLQFKNTFITIQAMLDAWYNARVSLAQNCMPGLGYSSYVWVINCKELEKRLVRYTGLCRKTISNILFMLTFGKAGIQEPDITIQPLINLENGNYVLSPFVWLYSNVERNLCVLLNQIESEKKIYSKLMLRQKVFVIKYS